MLFIHLLPGLVCFDVHHDYFDLNCDSGWREGVVVSKISCESGKDVKVVPKKLLEGKKYKVCED